MANDYDDYVEQTLKAVKNQVVKMQYALKNNDYQDFITLVDPETINYFDQIRKLTISSDDADLDSYSSTQVFYILILRHRVPKSVLETTSKSDFFIYMLKNHILNFKDLFNIDLDKVKVSIRGNVVFLSSVNKENNQPQTLNFKYSSTTKTWRYIFTDFQSFKLN